MNSSDATESVHAAFAAIGARARWAARAMAKTSTDRKNQVLHALAGTLRLQSVSILEASGRDLERARQAGLEPALVDRLTLTSRSVELMAEGLEQVARLPDPIGAVSDLTIRPTGIQVGRMRVPLGVIGIIYESRPNVTIDAAALCIKSGNAAILRGGSEALECNRILAGLIAEALQAGGLPADGVQLIASTDRAWVGAMAVATEYIDVLVPRGGKSLIERLMREARVPMIKHLDGLCAVYVDEDANLEVALSIADNAKTQRYGTCNTMETLLVHRSIAASFLPRIAAVYRAKGVEMRGDDKSRALLSDIVPAEEADFSTEFLAPIVAIKVVGSADEAIEHINRYGSHHTDAIITEKYELALRFLREVDSASVMVNASTRFADGYEFGLGAEIGISNDKLHARGPVGLEGLTSLKYVVFGHGEIRT